MYVYRMYNPNAGDHHYTAEKNEKDWLRYTQGWEYEGIGWHTPIVGGIPVYRLYNPNAKTGAHHYTLSAGERDALKKVGWRDEGIGWRASARSANTSDKVTDLYKRVYEFQMKHYGKAYPVAYIGSGYKSGATQNVFTIQPDGKPISHASMVINVETGAMWGVGLRNPTNGWQ
nr:hypothetical protein [Enterococcus sp. CSURQ0835]